ncbi:hypothetical protein [Microbacterium oleivorans]|uniref:Uncharacterized protein n=1 Tax=Microbacterium oleivorans TaxID=273677 RepID=A0A7D5EUL5_9MICO|nr:hypothetical protein [Microbacterium oleivorans]QLD10871.1 hypothetical protein HW566_03185 [Microbacterium oleivorans]
MTLKPYDEDAYLKRFHAEYLSPDDAGMPLDNDSDSDDAYFWTAPRHSSEEAVAALFESELDDAQLADLADTLNSSYGYWARRDEL